LEDFKSIVLKNTLIKVLELVLIFTLVKTANDLPIYTAIMCGSYLLGTMVIIPSAIKRIKFVKPDWKLIGKHLKPVLILSIYTLSTGIYSVLDKTILGIFCEKAEVGIYDYGEKLIKIVNTILTTVGTVMLPRMSYLFEKKDKEKLVKFISYSFIGIGFLAFGCVFGILGVADDFILLYYGKEFMDCSFVMKCLTPIILIVSFGNIIRTQYILPSKKDKMYVISFLMSMIINAIIDFALIPFMGINGAIIGTIAAELTSVLIQFISVRKEIPVWMFLCKTIPFLFSGIVMFAALFVLNYFHALGDLHVAARLVIEFVIGLVIYLGVAAALAYTILRKDTKAILANLFKRKRLEENIEQ
ncbi:MAG: polysaccharide biosynthesis C-terminal domain-containing protein, partial [Anaeroplasmataceae bacterium]|nr:polysaccharide biosynthesis C-terminal domain-containing protein [Anaeroplasmataceae bacterium]